MRLFYNLLLVFSIPSLAFSHGFEKKRFYTGINLQIFTSDKVFDSKRNLREIEYKYVNDSLTRILEYIEKRLEVQFGFNIAYGLRMEFLIPVIGREMDYAYANVYLMENKLVIETLFSDINSWGVGDLKARIGGLYNIMKNLEGGAFFDFKLPTGSTSMGNGKIPLGTGQSDFGFYLSGRFFSDFLNGEVDVGYVFRSYGEPSYILYYPLPGAVGKGVDPGDEIHTRLRAAFKIKGSFWGGIDLDLRMTQGDGIKFLVLENSELKEEWGYYDSSNYGYLKPFLSVRTNGGFISEIGFSFPFYGRNYPSEPFFPFLRNSPLFPSSGISASIGYNF